MVGGQVARRREVQLQLISQTTMGYLEFRVRHQKKSMTTFLSHIPSVLTMIRIEKAAKKMRIASHPDKLKKSGMTEEELKAIDEQAAKVGQAAEILSNPKSVSY